MTARRSLSILLYGNFSPVHLGKFYQRAFEQLKQRIIPLDTRDSPTYLTPWLKHRIGHRLTIRSLRLRQLGTYRWNRHVLSVARKERPDLIFILNGDLLMPSTLNSMRAQDTRIFIFHADNPFPPNYANRPETLPNALASDCFFIWSRHLVEQLQQLGVRRAEYLPFGWDSEIFPYFGLVAEPKYDVVFVGGWDKEREEFLTPLAEEFKLRIWGPSYWGNRTRLNSPLRKCWQGDAALGPEAAKILVNSKIVLNVVRQQNLPDGVIMRTFEVPGCGGFMLSTRTQGAVDLFPEDRAGAYFSDGEECVRQIKRFLVADQERQRMAANAHVLVQQQHRYVDRAQRILNVWDEL